jgi:hypothetical protein
MTLNMNLYNVGNYLNPVFMKTIPIIKKLSAFLQWIKVGAGDSKVDSGKELWEENYLVGKIKGKHDHIPEESIRDAVKACHFFTRAPQPGEKLIQEVLSKLGTVRGGIKGE